MHLEVKHLQLVFNIKTLGSLSKCADAMNITQPAASHLLKTLETHIGIPVFNRVNKKMILTKAGEVLLNTAKELLPRLELCKELLANEIEGNNGSIKISTECVTSYNWFPSLLSSFEKMHPNVDIEIDVEATGNPIKFLLDGKIDLAIVIDPIKNKNLLYHELFRDEILLVVPYGHKLQEKKYVTSKDLINENYFMYTEDFENNTVAKKIMIPSNIKPKKVSKLQLTDAIIEMVNAGRGVTTMSNWLLKPYLVNKQLRGVRITKNGMFRKWYLASLVGNTQKYKTEFIKYFQSEFS
ncbi:LysR family transcriptional regulator [uncultured Aquimarina sp.]|uniref:LysR family transcriptional regulator n=1 Tax=uncultured Aquimarina sp. TaxID=575652 RepID=UPI00262C9EBF|nr:LysR family transcriptional regulator [uncultured Aquimarina sp.]